MHKPLHARLTVAQLLTIAFGIVLVITMGLGFMSRSTILAIKGDAEVVTDDILPSVMLLNDIRSRVQENLTLMYRHGLATEETEMREIEAEMDKGSAEISKQWDEFQKLLVTDEDRRLVEPAQAARPVYRDARAQFLKFSRANDKEQAKQELSKSVRPAYDRYATAVRGLIQYHEKYGQEASAETRAQAQWALRMVVAALAAAVIAAACTGWFIVRRINRLLGHTAASLKDCSVGLGSASSQISGSSRVLAESASEQAASLEETSASLEEMASMTRRNAEHAQRAKDLATQTRQAADEGAATMSQMNQAMEQIKVASNNISRIIKTIDEIAFQTNILALNAAVEAARAGEAGMGFAVVADEVRNLAQRSAHAARETAQKIEDCIARSDAGVNLSAKVTGSLSEIVDRARQVDELVAEIATASREQSQGIDQVNTAVTQMDKVTQTNAASAEESASAAEELDAQAANLGEALNELLSLIHRNQSPQAAPGVPPRVDAAPIAKPVRTTGRNDSNRSPVKVNGRSIPLEQDLDEMFQDIEPSSPGSRRN